MNIRGPFPQRMDVVSLDELAEKEILDDARFYGYLLSLLVWSVIGYLVLFFGGLEQVLFWFFIFIVAWIFLGLLGLSGLILWIMNPFGQIFKLKAEKKSQLVG